MSLVNRVALIVRPKRRYKEWADSVAVGDEDPIFDLDEARATPAIYLVAPPAEASLQDLRVRESVPGRLEAQTGCPELVRRRDGQ